MRQQFFFLLALLAPSGMLAAPATVTFGPPIGVLTNHPAAASIALGDFNGDGRRDFGLAFANGTTSIRTNPGIGSAGPRRTARETSPIRVEPGGADIAMADLDHDGVDDWVSVDYTNRLLLITGGGNSMLTERRSLPKPPSEVQIADLDRDGNLDIVVAYGDGTGSLLRGTADGHVEGPIDLTLGGGPVLALADFNLDGVPDLISGSSFAPRITMSTGNGGLSFSQPQTLVDLPGGPGSYVEGLAITSPRPGETPLMAVSIREGATRRLYVVRRGSTPVLIVQSSGPLHASFADMNRDTIDDLVIADAGTRRVSIRDGAIDRNWEQLAELDLAPNGIASAVAGDVSGDGIPDVIVGTDTGPLLVYVNTTAAPTPAARRRASRH